MLEKRRVKRRRHKKELKDVNIKFCLNNIPSLEGKISDSFEPYLKPYIDKEEA